MQPINQDHEEDLLPESPNLPGNGVENLADESNILSDQDETLLADTRANDANLGSDGTDEDFGLDQGEFARGEIDVKEQMDRMTANMNAKLHRETDPQTTPMSEEGRVDTIEAIQSGMSRKPDEEAMRPISGKGHETGAFTDIGAGKSGVTRTHH